MMTNVARVPSKQKKRKRQEEEQKIPRQAKDNQKQKTLLHDRLKKMLGGQLGITYKNTFCK